MISGIREAVGRADDATAYSMVERSGTSSLAADVLEKLPSWPVSRLDELLPYRQ
ncbi:hypothetical protein ACVN4P_14185 [Escherichia coli]